MIRRFFYVLLIALYVVSVFGVPKPVDAATLTAASLALSRQKISLGANHQYRFITPTGVDASTDTITLTFASGFDVFSILFSDVDIFHGGIDGFETNEDVAASPAAGVWGAAVSGQVLTLTPPTNAVAGEIGAGESVVIRIGTEVAGGANQINNPSSPGVYTVAIGGVFGDSLTHSVPISSDDKVQVSATVPAANGGGGGGGGGGSQPDGNGNTIDGIAPIISGFLVRNITSSSAEVVWTTDEAADAKVEYGITLGYASGTIVDATRTTGHSFSLSNLSKNTQYFVRVTSKDAAGNETVLGGQSFTTLAEAAPLAFVQAIAFINSSGNITASWTTNVPTVGVVEYGTTMAYGQVTPPTSSGLSGARLLAGLQPGTLYHVRIVVTDVLGNTITSNNFALTTPQDRTPPTNVSQFLAIPQLQQISLSWGLPPEPDFKEVIIYEVDSQGNRREIYRGVGTSLVYGGLQSATTYNFVAVTVDQLGNTSAGVAISARTLSPEPNENDDDNQDGQGNSTSTVPNATTSTIPFVTSTTPDASVTSTFPDVATSTIPVTVTPTSTEPIPTETGEVYVLAPAFFVANGTIEIAPDALGRVEVPAGTPVLVRVSPASAPATPVSAQLLLGSQAYNFSVEARGYWSTSLIPLARTGSVSGQLVVAFSNGARAVSPITFVGRSGGYVYEKNLLGKQSPIHQAKVYIYEEGALWNASAYGQSNPVLTAKNGTFTAIAPRGTYRLVIQKEGYETKEVTVKATGNVIAASIELFAESKGVLDITPEVRKAIEALQEPEVKETANAVGVVTAAVAVANASAAATAFNILNYLRFIFTQPFLLLGRRRRKPWGIIYNSLSKQPVDLAVVRLIHVGTNLLVQSRVTDAQGRFSFFVPAGSYRIEVSKDGFTFPSDLLKSEKQDGDFLDVYHGELVEVKKDASINVSIPLDPIVKEELPKKIVFKRYLRTAQQAMGILGLFVAFIALVINPSLLMAGFFAGQVFLFVVFKRLAIPPKPKEWGVVYGEGAKSGVERAVVRIFSKRFNKLLETQVTDRNGKYGFYANKDVYYVTAEHPEYEKYQSSDLDLTKGEQKLINQDIKLKKRNP